MKDLRAGVFLLAEHYSSGHLQQGKGTRRGRDLQECLGAFSTSYVGPCTTLPKAAIQNYILSHLGKVRQPPALHLILRSLKKYLDQQVKASVLKPHPASWRLKGQGGGMRSGGGGGAVRMVEKSRVNQLFLPQHSHQRLR